jgi:hypothetical protein
MQFPLGPGSRGYPPSWGPNFGATFSGQLGQLNPWHNRIIGVTSIGPASPTAPPRHGVETMHPGANFTTRQGEICDIVEQPREEAGALLSPMMSGRYVG